MYVPFLCVTAREDPVRRLHCREIGCPSCYANIDRPSGNRNLRVEERGMSEQSDEQKQTVGGGPAPGDTVQIPRRTFTVLVSATALSVMALCFLLGRASVAPPAPPAPAAVATTAPVPESPGRQVLVTGPAPPQAVPAVAPPALPAPVPAPVSAPPPVEVAVAPAAPAPQATRAPVAVPAVAPAQAAPAPAPAAPPKPAVSPEQAARIRTYLDQVDTLTAGTAALGDPNEFATDLLNQAMIGETGGIDRLITQTEQARQKLAHIKAPRECGEHHRLLSNQLAESQAMLRTLKSALVKSDTAALTGLASQGRGMQAEATRLQQVTDRLRRISGS